MLHPIGIPQVCIADGIAAMQHLIVPNIDSNMGYGVAALICSCKKHQITWFHLVF